jgi:hypothetical protein
MLLGAAMLLICLIVTDFFGYLEGKESVLGRILEYFKVKFPDAFKEMSSALQILKKEIEGITLFWMGIFTGDKAMISYGLSQIQESFGMMQEEGKRQVTTGNIISRIPTKQVNTEAGPNDSWWKKLISGSKKGSPSLWQELMGRRGNEATMNFPVATARDEWSLSNPSEITKSNVMSFNMPVEVNFSNVPNGITAEQMVPILKNTMIQTIDGRLDEILRSNRSSVESRQY